MGERFQVDVVTHGDTSGAEKVTAALQGTTKATEAHGHAAHQAGGLVETFGSRHGAAAHALHGFEMAAHGGAHGILGIGMAWKALTHAFAENPFTAALVVIFAVVGVVQKLREHLGHASHGAKELVEEMEKLAEAGKKVGEAKLDKLNEALKEADESAKRLAETLDAMLSAEERVDKAREKVELLQNAQNPMIGEEQKARNEAAIKQKYLERTTTRERDKLSIGVQLADSEVSNRSDEAEAAKKQRDHQKQVIEDTERRIAERKQLEKDVEKQAAITGAWDARAGRGASAQWDPRVIEARTRLRDMRQQLEALTPADELERMKALAEGRLQGLESNVEKTQKSLDDQRKKRDHAVEQARIKAGALTESADLEGQAGHLEANPKIQKGAEDDATKRLSTFGQSMANRLGAISGRGLSRQETDIIEAARKASQSLSESANDKNQQALVQALYQLAAAARLHGSASAKEFERLTRELNQLSTEQAKLAAQIKNAKR